MAEEPSPEVDVGVGAAALSDDEVGSDIDLGDEDDDDDDEVLQDMLRYDSVDEVAKVLHSKQLGKLLESIEAAMTPADAAAATATTALAVGSSEYLLLQDANQMMQSLEADMRKTAKFMIDHYHVHLPELEQMVPDPVLYAKVALAVRDTTDLDPIRKELEGFLEQKVVLSLSYTLSRRRDQHIGEDGWERVKGAAEMTLQLHDARQMLLEYVISRMSRLAPQPVVPRWHGGCLAARLCRRRAGTPCEAQLQHHPHPGQAAQEQHDCVRQGAPARRCDRDVRHRAGHPSDAAPRQAEGRLDGGQQGRACRPL